MLGITPIFVFASIIESFLTRYTDVPDIVRIMLILISASFIIGYFGVYPWLKSQRGFSTPLKDTRLPPALNETPALDKIKNNAEILKDAFLLIRKHGGTILRWVFFVSIGLTVADLLLKARTEETFISYLWWLSIFQNLYYSLGTPDFDFVLLNAGGATVVVFVTFSFFADLRKRPMYVTALQIVQIFAVFCSSFLLIFQFESTGIFIAGIFSGFILLHAFIIVKENKDLITAIGRVWDLTMAAIGQVLGLQLMLILLTFSFLLMLSAPLLYINLEVLEWQFAQSDEWARNLINFTKTFIRVFAFHLTLPLMAGCAVFLYFSLKEISGAENLINRISQVGTKNPLHKK
jgi:hypothetical protein